MSFSLAVKYEHFEENYSIICPEDGGNKFLQINQPTQCNIPVVCNLDIHHCVNLTSYRVCAM
jgi:hypothetical protein